MVNMANIMPDSYQDWEAISRQYASPELLKMVLKSFLKHHLEVPAELRTLIANQQFEPLGKLAHKLRGAACVMRAPFIVKLSETVEAQVMKNGFVDGDITESLASAMNLWVEEVSSKLASL
jgi:HPt (histidine-containing phosphotransfer) domain-containing protein